MASIGTLIGPDSYTCRPGSVVFMVREIPEAGLSGHTAGRRACRAWLRQKLRSRIVPLASSAQLLRCARLHGVARYVLARYRTSSAGLSSVNVASTSRFPGYLVRPSGKVPNFSIAIAKPVINVGSLQSRRDTKCFVVITAAIKRIHLDSKHRLANHPWTCPYPHWRPRVPHV